MTITKLSNYSLIWFVVGLDLSFLCLTSMWQIKIEFLRIKAWLPNFFSKEKMLMNIKNNQNHVWKN